MSISKFSVKLIIASIYLLTLFCGTGTIFSNNIIEKIRLIFQIGLPFIINLSILKDQFRNFTIFRKYKFCILLIILNIIWFALSIFLGINIGLQSIKGLFNFVNILLLVFLIANVKFNVEDSKSIKKSIYISAILCAIYGIIQYIFKIDLNIFENGKYPGIFGRINSTFYLATIFDKYMAIIVSIACYNLLKKDNVFFKILFFLAGINLILTFSRGGLIALIVIVIIFLLFSIIEKKVKNILLLIVFFFTIFLIPGTNYLFQQTADYAYNKLNIPEEFRINFVLKSSDENEEDYDDMSLKFRDYYNKIGLQFIKENPLFGVGLNNYSYLYNNQNALEYLENKSVVLTDVGYMYPHNGYIQLGAETGIVGLILLLTYLLYISIYFLKRSNEKYKFFSLIIFVLFLLGSYTESLIYNKQYAFVFLILFSLFSNPFFYKDSKNDIHKKKKISFLLLHLGSGGIETATINTANSLSSKYDITLVSLYKKGNEITDLINNNVKIIHLLNYSSNKEELCKYMNEKKFLKLFKEIIKAIKILYLKKYLIKKYIISTDSDVVISTRMEFSTLLSKYGLDSYKKIACEHQHHNNDIKYINTIKRKYKNLNVLVALTSSLNKDYAKFLKNNKDIKIITIPNMISDDDINISNLENKKIVSIGRLHKGKRVNEIIDIYTELNTDYTLDIAGEGEEYLKLKSQIEDYKINKKVKLLGNLTRKQVNNLLQKSDIFVMTSISEGLPMVLIEAMKAGVVCIAYETDSGITDIIDDSINGYVIKNRNKEEFINKLNFLINNKKELKRLQKNAIRKSKEFSSKNVRKKWIELIEEVI